MASLQKAAAPHGLRFGPDPSHAGPRDARRDDRQQRVRSARGRLRADRGQRARARRGRRHRPALRGALRRGRARRRARVSTSSSARTSTSSGPSWAASAGRSPATRSSTCCPRRAPTWPRRWSAPRGRSARCSARRSGWSRSRPRPCSSCSATRTCPTAADAVPALLAHAPLAIEGMDSRLVDVVRRVRGAAAVPAAAAGRRLAHGRGRRRDLDEALDAGARARRRRRHRPPSASSRPVRRPPRCGGSARTAPASAAGRRRASRPGPGFEDSAVPPERLGAYLRELEALMASHGVDGLAYGHFGDGCVHLRLDIPLERSGNPLRAFMTDAATLVASHGGSLSGRARRRPRALRAAAGHVLAEGDRPVRRVQGPARPARPAQPRRARPARARSTPTCAARGPARCSPTATGSRSRTTPAT